MAVSYIDGGNHLSWYLVWCLGKRWACPQWSFQIC